MDISEWAPLAVGIAAIISAVVLTALEHFGIIDLGDHEPKEEACRYCGSTPVCDVCGRCFDPYCNTGCVFCRDYSRQREETCPYCGQEVRR